MNRGSQIYVFLEALAVNKVFIRLRAKTQTLPQKMAFHILELTSKDLISLLANGFAQQPPFAGVINGRAAQPGGCGIGKCWFLLGGDM